MAKMPAQKPGKSEQTVCTPPVFLQKLKYKLGITEFVIDLAADKSNTVAPHFYSEEDNALTQSWQIGEGWAFCNPPFANIRPWVEKANSEKSIHANIAMLLPASIGSNWWAEYVHDKARVLILKGRLTFVGHTTCYPKDLVVLLYSPRVFVRYEIWDWKAQNAIS